MNNDMAEEDRIVNQALDILTARMVSEREVAFLDSRSAKDYARLQLTGCHQEVFAVFLLDTQHRLIEYREMFFGSIAACPVFPREVVRICMERNAAAVIFAHNHPSGVEDPSREDMATTEDLVKVLKIIDVRVLDHLIVGHVNAYSFAEQGLLMT